VSSPFTTSNSYDYDYGNTNTAYTILCQNIGGHTVSGNSVYTQFRTPKKFNVVYYNPDGNTADKFASSAITAIGGYQDGIL
jgi:hypothetical protein